MWSQDSKAVNSVASQDFVDVTFVGRFFFVSLANALLILDVAAAISNSNDLVLENPPSEPRRCHVGVYTISTRRGLRLLAVFWQLNR